MLKLAAAGVAAVVVVGGLVLAVSAGSPYSFDGAPPAPAAYSDPHLDVQVHSRDQSTWYSLEGMAAQHGTDCSAPPATHLETGSYADAVFQCKDHVMTSINAGGYGEIILTPDTMADFSAATATITWDVSTFRSAPTRDWFDVWITPFAGSKVYPLEEFYPDLSGPPQDAVHVLLGDSDTFCPHLYRAGAEVSLDPGSSFGNGCQWWQGYDSILTPSATVRTTFKIEISKTHLKVSIPAQESTNQRSIVFFDGDIPGGLPFSQAVVQFGHHSYNPTKDGGQPGTWHWDNLTISPGLPITMIKPDRRYADASHPTVTFARPAPAGSYLRLHAVANSVRASFNGGPMQGLMPLPSNKNSIDPQYFVPVPAGTTQVTLDVTPSWIGSWIADGFGIWATGTSAPSTPTNTPAPTSTGTVAPTSTATATPTPTPSPTPIPTSGDGIALIGVIILQGSPNSGGATLSVTPGGVSVLTDANGSFMASGLLPGTTYLVTASHDAFLNASRTVTTPSSGTVTLPDVTLLAGDIDGDGRITITDVSLVASLFGATTTSSSDINGNGVVDIGDVSVVATNFGSIGPSQW